MNYKVTKKDHKFSVIEITTDQMIKNFSTEKEARGFMKHLNGGGGFAGWSPTFVIKKVAHI